ncbi:SAM-dependent methyltransferase [Streptomyces sp. CAU 1734]|uniref:SAM-dependent methyltransferase n=1 Tax=Streptomyces sp. CAU 1734 TaxID=3140360 RepID=UPI0032603B5F
MTHPHDPTIPPPHRPAASTARLYAAYQGGGEERAAYDIDRDIAARVAELGLKPTVIARQNRLFHNRAVTFAAAELGISQFLDIGCGLPSDSGIHTHTLAEAHHPDTSQVLYVDRDPMVRAPAEALMRGSRDGSTRVLEADVRDPDRILDQAREFLDFQQPVALLLIAVVHFLADSDEPHATVRYLTDALPPGSALVFSHVTDAFAPDIMRAAEDLLRGEKVLARTRSHESISRFFDGLTPVEPGLVPVHRWHQSDAETLGIPDSDVHTYAGIALT